MTFSARVFVVNCAFVGVVVGLLGALGWRYATRRLVVLDNPPTMNSGDKGFMFSFDSLRVVAGPQWWPGLLLMPATGVVVAVTVGILCWLAFRSSVYHWAAGLLLAVPALATGAGVAIATLVLTREDRPALLVRAVTGMPSASSSKSKMLTDSQWDREWTPIGLWFPVTGIVSALLITFVLLSVCRMMRRT